MFKIQEIGWSPTPKKPITVYAVREDKDSGSYCDFETVEFLIYKDDNWVWVNGLCYEPYGLKRTGCCGCPFGKDYQNELDIVKQFELRMYNGICNIFKDSYEYTKRYREFVKERKLDIR